MALSSPPDSFSQRPPTIRAGAIRTIHLLTTPDGANLPDSASLTDFPVLVRLDKDWFNFDEAKPDGADLRVSSSSGEPLSYQVEEWDPGKGTASVWVRVPSIKGNAVQPLKLHWGKPEAVSESNPKAVFNPSNGHLSVWHMSNPVVDDAGATDSKDQGTTATGGIVGQARHLAGGQGIFGGDKITPIPRAPGR